MVWASQLLHLLRLFRYRASHGASSPASPWPRLAPMREAGVGLILASVLVSLFTTGLHG